MYFHQIVTLNQSRSSGGQPSACVAKSVQLVSSAWVVHMAFPALFVASLRVGKVEMLTA